MPSFSSGGIFGSFSVITSLYEIMHTVSVVSIAESFACVPGFALPKLR